MDPGLNSLRSLLMAITTNQFPCPFKPCLHLYLNLYLHLYLYQSTTSGIPACRLSRVPRYGSAVLLLRPAFTGAFCRHGLTDSRIPYQPLSKLLMRGLERDYIGSLLNPPTSRYVAVLSRSPELLLTSCSCISASELARLAGFWAFRWEPDEDQVVPFPESNSGVLSSIRVIFTKNDLGCSTFDYFRPQENAVIYSTFYTFPTCLFLLGAALRPVRRLKRN